MQPLGVGAAPDLSCPSVESSIKILLKNQSCAKIAQSPSPDAWRRERSGTLFSYVSIEERIPASHPLRRIRRLADQALDRLNLTFGELYASEGSPSVELPRFSGQVSGLHYPLQRGLECLANQPAVLLQGRLINLADLVAVSSAQTAEAAGPTESPS